MTTERCNYRTRSIALDWGPLRENVERAGRGREPIRRLATVAPERGRSPSAECRDDVVREGAAGVRHFIAASWQRRQRGGSAPRRNLSLTVAGSLSPSSSVTFDGRTRGRSPSVTSVSTLVQHVYDVSVISKSDSWVDDKSLLVKYWNTVTDINQTTLDLDVFMDCEKWHFWIFANLNSAVDQQKGLQLSDKYWILNGWAWSVYSRNQPACEVWIKVIKSDF